MGHGPTGGVYLSTEPVSRRPAESAGKPDWHIRFLPLRWAASGKGKEASGGGDVISRLNGKIFLYGPYVHAHAPTFETAWRRTSLLRGVATREVRRPAETVSFLHRLPQQRS